MKKYIAELIGTALLVLIGCGTAIFVGSGAGSVLSIALAFGVALILISYLISNISGAHVNPAVTIALALAGKFSWNKVLGYILAQILGALLGSVILFAIVSNMENSALFINNGFATNSLMFGVGNMSAALIEIVMTMVFCLVILNTTKHNWVANNTPIASGLALFVANLVAIPLTGASINPARSIGPALVSGQNLDSLGIFIIAPILGAILAYFIYNFVLGPGYSHEHWQHHKEEH